MMPTWIKGVDVAFSRISRPWARDRRNEGFGVFVQNLWTGGYQNNPQIHAVAEANLSDAKEEGFTIAAYGNANPWYSVETTMREIILNAGSMWPGIPILAADCEIEGLTEAHIKGLCDAIDACQKKSPIYSAAWFWRDHLGNPQWPWLKQHRIWEAYYDLDPDVDFLNRRFGPWELADVVGEQYQGTVLIDGVDVDLNVFDLDYWGGDDMVNDWALVDLQARNAVAKDLTNATQVILTGPVETLGADLKAAVDRAIETAKFWNKWPK